MTELDLVQAYVRNLQKLKYETEPFGKGDTHVEKDKKAFEALDIFWFLQSKTVLWAQAHIAGRIILRHYADLKALIEKERNTSISANSHINELVGSFFIKSPFMYSRWTDYDSDDEALSKSLWFSPPSQEEYNVVRTLVREYISSADLVSEEVPDMEVLLSPEVLRDISFELLRSRNAENVFWLAPLSELLQQLNAGYVGRNATPTKKKSQGNAHEVQACKLQAVLHVNFGAGEGRKKEALFREIGRAIGRDAETVRGWEKAAKRDPNSKAMIEIAKLAGSYKCELQRKPFNEIEGFQKHGTFRDGYCLEIAQKLLKDFLKPDYDDLRAKLRKSLSKKSGV